MRLSCPKLLKQNFVDESCKIMNKSDSEESVENWLGNCSSEDLKKKKQSTIINFADKITTQEQKKYVTLLALAIYASASPVETVATIAVSDSVRLICDGWSKICNEPIINFVISQPKPIFWKSFHTYLQSHTGEYIATKILKVIEQLESECGKMVFGVFTDNASNMKKAWRLI